MLHTARSVLQLVLTSVRTAKRKKPARVSGPSAKETNQVHDALCNAQCASFHHGITIM